MERPVSASACPAGYLLTAKPHHCNARTIVPDPLMGSATKQRESVPASFRSSLESTRTAQNDSALDPALLAVYALVMEHATQPLEYANATLATTPPPTVPSSRPTAPTTATTTELATLRLVSAAATLDSTVPTVAPRFALDLRQATAATPTEFASTAPESASAARTTLEPFARSTTSLAPTAARPSHAVCATRTPVNASALLPLWAPTVRWLTALAGALATEHATTTLDSACAILDSESPPIAPFRHRLARPLVTSPSEDIVTMPPVNASASRDTPPTLPRWITLSAHCSPVLEILLAILPTEAVTPLLVSALVRRSTLARTVVLPITHAAVAMSHTDNVY